MKSPSVTPAAAAIEPNGEPITEIVADDGTLVTLLGTAHISQASADTAKSLVESGAYDSVAVELCPSRHNAIVDPDAISKMDLFQVIRERKAALVAAHLALGAYQQRMAEQLGIVPGAEMRAAIDSAQACALPVALIDREIGVTLKRIYHNVSWWRRINLLAGVVTSALVHRPVTAEEVERLKEGDMLESTFAQFAEQAQELYHPLIEERDRYMSARIAQEVRRAGYRRLLVIIGAGHMRGMADHLRSFLASGSRDDPAAVITELDSLPRPSRWPKLLPWLIVALILFGFFLGFTHSPALGWKMVADWILINGGLAAFGALVAAAHPLTVLVAFLAAPLTSLNPMIGAGMVTAACEVYLRRPSVADFSRLRIDTATVKGWWRNRVARTLLIFLLSTFGSAAGTYLAGALIYQRLSGT